MIERGGADRGSGIVLTLLFVCLIQASCTSMSIISKGEREIQPGMTGAQVVVLFGEAQFRQENGEKEIWQYCRTGITEDEFLAVWFTAGRTTGITSYSDSQGKGQCTGFFQQLPWGMAPDATADEQMDGLQQFLLLRMLRQLEGDEHKK